MNKLEQLWGRAVKIYHCIECGSHLLRADAEDLGQDCPLCGQKGLIQHQSEGEDEIYEKRAEMIYPFQLDQEEAKSYLKDWMKAHGPEMGDFKLENLVPRLKRFYLSSWLVDTIMQVHWRAEVGEPYEAVVHQEHFQSGSWQTEKQRETRYQWIPHVGRVRRIYHNLPVDAYEDGHWLLEKLGEFVIKDGEQYEPSCLEGSLGVLLPTRHPSDSWMEVEPAIRTEVEADCQRALGGRPLQEFHWAVQSKEKEWSKGLLPVYVTHYVDSSGKRRMVYIHGQTGFCIGDYVPSLGWATFRLVKGLLAGICLMLFGLILLTTVLFYEIGFVLLEKGTASIRDGIKQFVQIRQEQE